MLFSNDNVAELINSSFEPVWVSVRPVPIVSIDFGNGKVLKRTLHGNIATYVCDDDGRVLDIMPGIYEPGTYRKRLQEFVLLHQWFHQEDQSSAALRRYHAVQATALSKGERPLEIARQQKRENAADRFDFTKSLWIEGPLKLVLQPSAEVNHKATGAIEKTPRGLDAEKSQALWKSLAADTMANESERRLMIHQRLSGTGPVPPMAVTRWLYREVLHADLDDPYQGLGDMLFASYPFKD